MIKYILIAIALSGCGGGSSSLDKPVTKPPVIIDPPVKDTLIIHRNNDDTSLSGASVDNGAIIVNAVFSQFERDRVEACNFTCFSLLDSVILGDDKGCIDCLELSKFLDFYERDHNIQVFIVVEDELSFMFTEGLASSKGYSNIVLVSTNEDLLLNAAYNYPIAIIGESNNTGIDWHITSNSDCSAKCVNPDGDGLGVYDGIINQP